MQVQYGTSIARCTMVGKVKVGMCVVRVNDCACMHTGSTSTTYMYRDGWVHYRL